jgi:basic membrane protein A
MNQRLQFSARRIPETPASSRTCRLVGAALTIVALACGLAACGGEAPKSNASDSEDTLSVGIFVDDAFGDGDFFDQAAAAEQPLESDLGATVNTYEGQLQAQNFEPLLQDAADANDIVFVLGFEAIDALTKVAGENPDTQFVFVDGTVDSPDVVSAQFRTAEGCFMAGALAAVVNQSARSKVAGFVGGVDAPVIKNCESGYRQGVAEVDDSQSVAPQYAGSFVDPSKGREIALSLANQGAQSIFAYAGLTGAGIFDAAKSGEPITPIGVVADKSPLAPGKTSGSLEMGVDVVILALTESYESGDLEQGSVHTYGFAEGGWDMVYDEKLVGADNVQTLKSLQERIGSGELTISE